MMSEIQDEKQKDTLEMEEMESPPMPADTGELRRTGDVEVERQIAARQTPEPSFWNDAEKEEVFRSRWIEVQSDFVDDPSDSVRNADELVAEVIESVSNRLTEERAHLEEQWADGNEVSTEDLRISLTRYRTLFDRLMKAGK